MVRYTGGQVGIKRVAVAPRACRLRKNTPFRMTGVFLFGRGLRLFARTMGGAFFGGELLNVA